MMGLNLGVLSAPIIISVRRPLSSSAGMTFFRPVNPADFRFRPTYFDYRYLSEDSQFGRGRYGYCRMVATTDQSVTVIAFRVGEFVNEYGPGVCEAFRLPPGRLPPTVRRRYIYVRIHAEYERAFVGRTKIHGSGKYVPGRAPVDGGHVR